MNKVIVRAISGIVYIALIVGAILGGQPWFGLLMTILGIMAAIEFATIDREDAPTAIERAAHVTDIIATAFIISIPLWFSFALRHDAFIIGGLTGCTFLLAYPVLRFILALYDKSGEAVRSTAMSMLSVVYISVPLGLLSACYSLSQTFHSHIILATFVMIWINDTGAFCVGSLWGRRRLFERLSPKKSWEGFWGGLAFTLLSAILLGVYAPGENFGLMSWIVLGIIVSVFATLGDLFESMFKRNYHVKDSGHIMPGHGGILDRIDSLLFVSVALAIFLIYKDALQ